MAKKLPYYPMYVDDFDDDQNVIAMSLTEVGLYQLMLNAAWRFGSIPDDAEATAILIRRKAADVKKAWPKVRACFVLNCDPGRLVNPRQEMEREKALGKSDKGTKAALIRHHGKTSGTAQSMRPHDLSMDLALPHAYGSVSESESEIKESPLETAIVNSAERIHSRHPAVRRCGIGEVRDKLRTIAKALPSAERITALEFIDSQHAAWCGTEGWTKDGGEYSKGLDNWLAPTKRRWENQPPEAVAPRQQAKSAIDRQNEIIQRKERERLESSRSN